MRVAGLVVGSCIAAGCGRFSFDVTTDPACGDGIKDEAETDIDCGGPDCGKCADGNACLTSSDCAGGHCGALMCNGWTAPAFAYRRLVTVDHSAGDASLVDYPVAFTLDTAALISAGKMQANCADLLVMPVDASTPAPYWIESGCGGPMTTVWVKVSAIAASSSTALWVYYGDPTAASTSNGLAVFPVFDDFETGDLSRWTVTVVGAVPTSASTGDKHGGGYAWANGPSVCPSNSFSNYTVTLTWSPSLSLPTGTWRTEYWRREPRDWGGVFFPASAPGDDLSRRHLRAAVLGPGADDQRGR